MIERLKILAAVTAVALYLAVAWTIVITALVLVGGWNAVIIFALVLAGTAFAVAAFGGRR